MKIILTEHQIKKLVEFKQVESFLLGNLNESKNGGNLRDKIKKLILSGVAISSVIAAIASLNVEINEKRELAEFARQEQVRAEHLKQKQDSILNVKVNACSDYMKKALNNQGFSLDSTKLNPEAMVKVAESEDFDLPLIMAAAHLESCFGATPRAQRTNSVFSVGSYDSGKDVVTYSHPDESIYGYIKLLKNDYLIDGKTIDDLLQPGSFVNKNGHRYASKKNYEALLKSIRNKIIRQYPELA